MREEAAWKPVPGLLGFAAALAAAMFVARRIEGGVVALVWGGPVIGIAVAYAVRAKPGFWGRLDEAAHGFGVGVFLMATLFTVGVALTWLGLLQGPD